MQLSNKAIEKYQEIIQRMFGMSISLEEAEKQGLNLLWLLDRISQKDMA